MKRNAAVSEIAIATVAALVAMTVYALAFLRYMPDDGQKLGSDFSYFLPQLLAGQYWHQQNGLFSIPWFTPAFCAGVPYYPNLQGVYFSVPQFLAFVTSPVAAIQATFMIFAALGFIGFHLLLRLRFRASPWMSIAGATLFLFNGFYYSHYIAGHLTFHAYMLMPFLAFCVLGGKPGFNWKSLFDLQTLFGGLIVAYMIQSGMVHAFPPAMASILALIFVHAMMFGGAWTPYIRMTVMVALGFVLSLSKLVAALAFLGNYQRDMLPLPGFTSLLEAVVVHFMSLFMEPPVGPAGAWLANNYWYPDLPVTFGYWELDAGITIVPLLLLLFALVLRLREPAVEKASDGAASNRRIYLAGLIVLFIVPVLLNWHQPLWTGFLKSLPIIGKSSTLLRWHAFYIPLVIVFSVIAIGRRPALASYLPHIAIASMALVFFMKLRLEPDYRMLYDPARIVEASAQARQTSRVPAVNVVENDAVAQGLMYRFPGVNDRMTRGATAPQCYEPMFGHKLEEYRLGSLKPGPALDIANGAVNIKNPACMVYPHANACRPGDHFTAAQQSQARAFLEYRSFEFVMPLSQRIANMISFAALIATLAAIAALLGVNALRALRGSSAQA